MASTAAHDDDRYLSLAQLADYSALSERTLRRAMDDTAHPLPHFRVGTKILVRKRDFDAWIERATPTPPSNPEFDKRVAAAVKDLRGQ